MGSENRSVTRQVRVSPGEDARLRLVAASRGISVSELLRGSALKKKVRGAAELERRLGAGAVSGSAASTTGSAPAADQGAGAAFLPAAAPAFRCPLNDGLGPGAMCEFVARSPKAVCPTHGRKVVAG
jgi:hypothetical protein